MQHRTRAGALQQAAQREQPRVQIRALPQGTVNAHEGDVGEAIRLIWHHIPAYFGDILCLGGNKTGVVSQRLGGIGGREPVYLDTLLLERHSSMTQELKIVVCLGSVVVPVG